MITSLYVHLAVFIAVEKFTVSRYFLFLCRRWFWVIFCVCDLSGVVALRVCCFVAFQGHVHAVYCEDDSCQDAEERPGVEGVVSVGLPHQSVMPSERGLTVCHVPWDV